MPHLFRRLVWPFVSEEQRLPGLKVVSKVQIKAEGTAEDGKPAPGGNPGLGTGSRRWAIWLVLSLAYLIVYFQRVSPAVIVDKLFAQFQIEAAAAVGSLAAIYFYAYFLMQIPAGILNDIYGPRKVVTAVF
jgi:hypothetical protein